MDWHWLYNLRNAIGFCGSEILHNRPGAEAFNSLVQPWGSTTSTQLGWYILNMNITDIPSELDIWWVLACVVNEEWEIFKYWKGDWYRIGLNILILVKLETLDKILDLIELLNKAQLLSQWEQET